MSRFRKSKQVGFIDEIADVATSAWDITEDVVTSVRDTVPGGTYIADAVDEVTGPLGDFIEGPLRDFSKTAVGEVVMRAFSVAVSSSVFFFAPAVGSYVFAWVGPALASAAVAIPGLAKGERFDEAFVKEAIYRVQYVISIFSKEAGEAAAKALGPILSDQLGKAFAEAQRVAKEKFPFLNTEEAFKQLGLSSDTILQNLGLTPKQMAEKLGIREDVAAMALSWVRRDPAMLERMREYDPITGRSTKDIIREQRAREYDALRKKQLDDVMKIQDPCAAYVTAVRLGMPDIAPVFKRQCEEAGLRKAWLNEQRQRIAAMANPCEAYVEAVKLQQSEWANVLKEKCAAYKARGGMGVRSTGPSDSTFAKASTRNYVLLGAGILLAVGGTAWYLRKRG